MTNAPRLSRKTQAPKAGIVHLGPGAFFRAFNAIYTQDAMEQAGGDWGIIAVSLRSPTARDQLAPQGGAFTSVSMAAQGAEYRQIDSIVDVLVAPENPAVVVAAMADPAIKIVSLTITEKGYCHAPSTGKLNLEHPDIQHDLSNTSAPRSAPGFIVEALAQRRAAGAPSFTVLSCDNLPSNGRLARQIVLDLAAQRDAGLADWIAQNTPFPATMVDRITPATTPQDVLALEQAQGVSDPASVNHEPFRQWVIEDDFAAGRPAWEAGGAQFVRDVEAHENMKLRCLNGTHSALAYLGYLAGYDTISDTVGDPDYARFVRYLWGQEILPAVAQPEGEDLTAYTAALLERYQNPSIRHRTWQIAMDGSQKLPQRLLGTIADNLAAGRPCPGLMLVVAGWMRYVGGLDETGDSIDVRDPLADQLRAASDSATDAEGKVAALLAMQDVFDPALAKTPEFRAGVTAAYISLMEQGAKACVANIA